MSSNEQITEQKWLKEDEWIIGSEPFHVEQFLREKAMRQQNQIAVALAYLEADQPNLAKLVLKGMEP